MLRTSTLKRTRLAPKLAVKGFSTFTKGKGERVPGTARYSTLNRFGKKAKLREKINRPLRAKFRRLGLLDVCEARLEGCWPDGRKTWSHGKKDRKLTMEERKNLVIRACTVCHRQMDEEMSPEEMLSFVQEVIARRESTL